MFTNLHTSGEGDSQDFAHVTGILNGFTAEMGFQRDELTAFREQYHATMKEKFERAASYLEERISSIQSGQVFRGMDAKERARHSEELFLIFQNQRTFAAQQQAEFPGLSAPRLLAVLDRLIAELERQKEVEKARSTARMEINSPTFPNLQSLPQRGCRRTAAKRAQVVAGVTR